MMSPLGVKLLGNEITHVEAFFSELNSKMKLNRAFSQNLLRNFASVQCHRCQLVTWDCHSEVMAPGPRALWRKYVVNPEESPRTCHSLPIF